MPLRRYATLMLRRYDIIFAARRYDSACCCAGAIAGRIRLFRSAMPPPAARRAITSKLFSRFRLYCRHYWLMAFASTLALPPLLLFAYGDDD